MNLSLFYFLFILFILLLIIDSTPFDNQCPTSRRLLLFKGLNYPFGEKKSHRSSSYSKSLPSSPPKYARSSDSHGLIVYIQPQTSHELGHKIHSYTHLLKSKLYTNEEKLQLKRLKFQKKKQIKKKNSTHNKSSINTKTKDLVSTNNNDLDRCRALLHIDSTSINEKKIKKIKNSTTQNIKKKISIVTKNLPINDKKIKSIKKNLKPELSSSTNKVDEKRSFTSPVKKTPDKSPTPPPVAVHSTGDTKSKRTKPETITIIERITSPFNDTNENEINEKNNSVVNRAFYFVRNMFQLSDDSLEENQIEDDRIIDITNKQQHHHSRKLLSINEDIETLPIITEDFSLNNQQSFILTSFSKRQLLSVKTNKHLSSSSSKNENHKDKKQKLLINSDANKPKVGWTYRYRISRYLNAQKIKHTGNKHKQTRGNKSKHLQKQKNKKKPTSLLNTKISKRKLLKFNHIQKNSRRNSIEIFDQNIIKTVSIIENFLPKRQLLTIKTKDQEHKEKLTKRHQMKSFDELTDPIAIVHSYDRGLYKPRVGWQFRYRVSRYIDSLRENIREDQERLKLGLQAIKRKTPQELSGRHKHVLDKSFTPVSDQIKKSKETIINQPVKPNAGWRYRYRISKMNEAKKRGDFIDDDNKEEKDKVRFEPKKKQSNSSKTTIVDNDNEPIKGESDLDPELRQINEVGRRVGWAYRYRIRRKLDYLKQQQIETGKPFDLKTLSYKGEKKVVQSKKIKSTDKKSIASTEEKAKKNNTKSVGWEHRYRVSKMENAQKHEKPSKGSSNKKPIVQEKLDPQLAKLSPEERTVGWKYRYRIRRKLDTLQHENKTGKRTNKSSSSKQKEKTKKKVKKSTEKTPDIDETSFMEYFRRTSSYIFFGLVPTAKKTLCLIPLPINFSFCNQQDDNQILSTTTNKKKRIKKLKTKKEQRAKQFIHSRITKLGAQDKATERRVDETMKKLYKKPSYPPLQNPPLPIPNEKKHHTTHSSKSHEKNDSIKKVIGVESQKTENKKQFQIISQKVKFKPKHITPFPTDTTFPPVVEVPKTTPAPPPLRTISEIIQQEAATILAGKNKASRTLDEIQDEINETKEIIHEQKKIQSTTIATTTTTTQPNVSNITTSNKEDNSATSLSDKDNDIKKDNIHDLQNDTISS